MASPSPEVTTAAKVHGVPGGSEGLQRSHQQDVAAADAGPGRVPGEVAGPGTWKFRKNMGNK